MLLENECEALKKWFEETYPGGTIKIHQGMNTKTKEEEYRIQFKMYEKERFAKIVIPPGGEDQDREYIDMYKKKFLEVNKKAIAQAIGQLVFQ